MLGSLMIWFVGFVVLTVLSLAGLLMVIRLASRQIERRIRRDGRTVMTAIMMANNSLYHPEGRSRVPGVVVFGYYEPSPQLAETLRAAAERCFELYVTPDVESLPPILRQFALLLKDDMYDADRRHLVPAEISGSASVYVADLWIHRDRLASGWQEHRVAACAVTGADQGEIFMLPPDDPAAVEIYAAAGLTAPAGVAAMPGSFQAEPKPFRPVAGEANLPPDSGARDAMRVFGCIVAAVALCSLLCLVGGYALSVALKRSVTVAERDPAERPPLPSLNSPSDALPRRPALRDQDLPQSGFAPTPEWNAPETPRVVEGGGRPPEVPEATPDVERIQPGLLPPTVSPPTVPRPTTDLPTADLPTASPPTASPPTADLPTVPAPIATPPPAAAWGSDALRIPFQSKDDITFGPIGCPIVIVGSDVWHFQQKKIVRQLNGAYNQRGMKALSGNGQWFAVASKSPNQQDTAIDVWNVVAGEPQCHIPGDPEKFRDLIQFSANRRLLLGGRHSNEIEVWDVESGEQLPSLKTPARRVDREQIALTADGEYFTSVVDERLTVIRKKSQKSAAVMESPAAKVDPRTPLNAIQRKIAQSRVTSMIKFCKFSPSGQELAIVSDLHNPRLCCWNAKGKLVFDELIPRVQHAFFFRPAFDWLPDGSGWIVSGHLVDRESKRIVMVIELPFAEDPLFFPLDRDRLVGAFPYDPKVLQVMEIPWDRINASLRLLEDDAPALLSPTRPVSIELEPTGMRGDAAATAPVLTKALAERLQTDGFDVAPGQASVFRLRFSERAGDTLPIRERQSPFDLRGRDTGRTATEVEGALVLELVAEGQVLWRDSLKATSSASFREEINDASIRASMLENLTRQMNRLSLPYFIPTSPDHLALPVVIQ